MKYNTETRRADGTFYRSGDWGVTPIRPPEVYAKNFTDIKPPEETLKYGVPCDWDGKKWVLDTESEEYLTLYQQKRVYPPEGEQLDMQYWDQKNGTTTWVDAITAVKEAFPKPS